MGGLFAAPGTVLFELDFALYFALIFAAPVVDAFAGLAGKFYESVLGHTCKI